MGRLNFFGEYNIENNKEKFIPKNKFNIALIYIINVKNNYVEQKFYLN